MLSRTTAGQLSYCPGVFSQWQLMELITNITGFHCTNCGLSHGNFSFEHFTPVQGTYIAVLNCDFCGLQIRVSPNGSLLP
jgi:hypothetical protein